MAQRPEYFAEWTEEELKREIRRLLERYGSLRRAALDAYTQLREGL